MKNEALRMELFHKCPDSNQEVLVDETGHAEDVEYKCNKICQVSDEESYSNQFLDDSCCLFCSKFKECFEKKKHCVYLSRHKVELLILLGDEK